MEWLPVDRLSRDASDSLTEQAIQVHRTYLVAETPEGMIIIDQHALHERILFEQLQARMRPFSTTQAIVFS